MSLEETRVAAERAATRARAARAEALLEERTRALALPRVRHDARGDRELLVFAAGEDRLGLWMDALVEIRPASELDPLFGAPAHVLGGLAVRSRMVTVFDLRVLLRLPAVRLVDLRHVLVVSAGEELVGLAVEALRGEQGVRGALVAAPGTSFEGATGDGALVLDVAALLRATGGRGER